MDSPMCDLCSLGRDILELIISFLGLRDVASFARTCRLVRGVVDRDSCWKRRCEQEMGSGTSYGKEFYRKHRKFTVYCLDDPPETLTTVSGVSLDMTYLQLCRHVRLAGEDVVRWLGLEQKYGPRIFRNACLVAAPAERQKDLSWDCFSQTKLPNATLHRDLEDDALIDGYVNGGAVLMWKKKFRPSPPSYKRCEQAEWEMTRPKNLEQKKPLPPHLRKK